MFMHNKRLRHTVRVSDPEPVLMTREVAHQKSFEKALHAISNNFAPGKLPGIGPYADMYVNASQGDGDVDGPWNSGEQWERVDNIDDLPEEVGVGSATVPLDKDDSAAADALAKRTQSDRSANPETGADLGAGPGAGRMTHDDYPVPSNVDEAKVGDA